MWRDIFLGNRASLLPWMDGLMEELGRLRQTLADQDGTRLLEILEEANDVHRKMVSPNLPRRV